MKKAIIITVSGDKREVDLGEDSYSVLSDAVGGYIECVELNPGLSLWVNEEGKLIGLPTNQVATRIWDTVFGFNTDIIKGDVILTGGADSEGNTLGLSDEMVALVEKLTPEFVKW